jgi:hypothetical protein
MDAVDVLTMAVDVARMIRSSSDPEAVLRDACRLVACTVGEAREPLSLRVTRLVETAGERRSELTAFLRMRRGQLYLIVRVLSGKAMAGRTPLPAVQLSQGGVFRLPD